MSSTAWPRLDSIAIDTFPFLITACYKVYKNEILGVPREKFAGGVILQNVHIYRPSGP